MKDLSKIYNDDYLSEVMVIISQLKKESLEELSLTEEKIVLDVGCGNGDDAIEISNQLGEVGHVYGIDVSDELISIAKSKLNNEGSNVSFMKMGVENMSFHDNFFDSIKIDRVFQHLPSIKSATKELYRVLKPNGKIVITETDWISINVINSEDNVFKKALENFVVKHLKSGMASRSIYDIMNDSGFQMMDLKVKPIVINDFRIADKILIISKMMQWALEEKIISKQEKESFEESIKTHIEAGTFNLTANMLLYTYTK